MDTHIEAKYKLYNQHVSLRRRHLQEKTLTELLGQLNLYYVLKLTFIGFLLGFDLLLNVLPFHILLVFYMC